jgi:hypothetical protein
MRCIVCQAEQKLNHNNVCADCAPEPAHREPPTLLDRIEIVQEQLKFLTSRLEVLESKHG